MDTAIISAVSALLGSLVGGVSTLAASWLTLHGQVRAQALVQEAAKREALYAEFIIEASRRLTDAWSHHAENPEIVAGLYSAVQRMRLASSDEVIRVADRVMRLVIQAYAEPDKTFDELRQHIAADNEEWDPLRAFAEACQAELRALRG